MQKIHDDDNKVLPSKAFSFGMFLKKGLGPKLSKEHAI